MKGLDIILILLTAMTGISCTREADDLYTYVAITVAPPEGVGMDRFQATMIFQDINSLRETSTSDFIDGRLEIQLLKGVYRLSIAEGGGIKYTEGNGHAGFREVTISNTPVELLDNTEVLTVELILK